MKTLHLRGSEAIIQQLITNVNQLAKQGEEIEIVGSEKLNQVSDWDKFLQNERLKQDLQESLEQIERGETYDQNEAFAMAFKRLGL